VGVGDKLVDAIFKATQSKPRPPKPKHEQTIILATYDNQGSGNIFAELFKRGIQKDIVVFKCCTIVHKILREGHHRVLDDAYARLTFFQQIRTAYENSISAYGKWSFFLCDLFNQ